MKLKNPTGKLYLNKEFDVTLTLADLIVINIATGRLSMFTLKQNLETTHLGDSSKYFTQNQIDDIKNNVNELYKNAHVYNETLEIIKKVVDKY